MSAKAPRVSPFLNYLSFPNARFLWNSGQVWLLNFRFTMRGVNLAACGPLTSTVPSTECFRWQTSRKVWAASSTGQIGPLEDSDLILTTRLLGFACPLGRHSRLSTIMGRHNLTHLSAYFLQLWRGRTIQFRQFLLFPSSAGIQQHPARWLTSFPWPVSFASQYGLFCTKAHMWSAIGNSALNEFLETEIDFRSL